MILAGKGTAVYQKCDCTPTPTRQRLNALMQIYASKMEVSCPASAPPLARRNFAIVYDHLNRRNRRRNAILPRKNVFEKRFSNHRAYCASFRENRRLADVILPIARQRRRALEEARRDIFPQGLVKRFSLFYICFCGTEIHTLSKERERERKGQSRLASIFYTRFYIRSIDYLYNPLPSMENSSLPGIIMGYAR